VRSRAATDTMPEFTSFVGGRALNNDRGSRLSLRIALEQCPLKQPFRITGHTFNKTDALVVTLRAGQYEGRGEGEGVYYRNDTPDKMMEQIEAVRGAIEAGVTRHTLQALLPPGGARNAVDCALWDLDAKRAGRAVWQMAGLESPRPLLTTFTLSADDPASMARSAQRYEQARALKLKLIGEAVDAERVRAVRAARPDAWLGVDANQGFTLASLEKLLPILIEARVELIEQPLAVGREADLDGFKSSIPLAADESAQDLRDLPGLVGRFSVVNIKLDKCGGLTEGLAMAREARRLGLKVMVGNMVGTSLAMAPAFIVGQLCDVVDLDGPIFLASDRTPAVVYEHGLISCPPAIWGTPA
jgi:L-alanine-DL-glutamate epimerase-like enolase superfamily enzyme